LITTLAKSEYSSSWKPLPLGVSFPTHTYLAILQMASSACRFILDAREVLGPPKLASPARKFQWEKVCEAIVCLTTLKAKRRRWVHLKKSLEEADLADRAKIVLSLRPCDSVNETCDVLEACKHSHLVAMDWARAQGYKTLLVLEDDVYFEVPALPRAIEACYRFLKSGKPFSTFLLGGVYLEAKATDVPGVLGGKGAQAHAWLINLQHRIWSRPQKSKNFRMLDLYNHQVGQTYMAYPGVAFQRDFSKGERLLEKPVYDLHDFPFFYRVLTRIGLYFGMRNCWEGCARRTNALSKYAGSIEVALIVLSSVLVCLVVGLGWLSSKFLSKTGGSFSEIHVNGRN
jgi:hypothetical protein